MNQGLSKKLRRTGYYWLAYDWDNLLLSQDVVNRSHKRNFFPLRDERTRAISHNDDFSAEQPMLINPLFEDPRDHIRFHKDVAYPLTKPGKVTIQVLKLSKDPFLEERRREEYERLLALKNLAMCFRAKANPSREEARFRIDAETLLAAAVKPDAQFSSMALDLIEDANAE